MECGRSPGVWRDLGCIEKKGKFWERRGLLIHFTWSPSKYLAPRTKDVSKAFLGSQITYCLQIPIRGTYDSRWWGTFQGRANSEEKQCRQIYCLVRHKFFVSTALQSRSRIFRLGDKLLEGMIVTVTTRCTFRHLLCALSSLSLSNLAFPPSPPSLKFQKPQVDCVAYGYKR